MYYVGPTPKDDIHQLAFARQNNLTLDYSEVHNQTSSAQG